MHTSIYHTYPHISIMSSHFVAQVVMPSFWPPHQPLPCPLLSTPLSSPPPVLEHLIYVLSIMRVQWEKFPDKCSPAELSPAEHSLLFWDGIWLNSPASFYFYRPASFAALTWGLSSSPFWVLGLRHTVTPCLLLFFDGYLQTLLPCSALSSTRANPLFQCPRLAGAGGKPGLMVALFLSK